MKIQLLSAVLLTGLCVSAYAGVDTKEMLKTSVTPRSDAGFYVAGYGGAQFDTDYGNNRQSFSGGVLGAGSSDAKVHSGWGAVGGLKAGYNFNSFPVWDRLSLRLQPAVEAEALYIGDHSRVSDFGAAGSSEHFRTNSGDFFINGILRFKNSSIVTPYVGVGVGLQYLTTHGNINIPVAGVSGNNVNTDDIDFAAQALFGIDVAVANHISVFTEYKFIDALGTDASTDASPGGGNYHFKPDQIQQNLITAGVKYSF
ncbi:MAG TPA: outer membrane beta-barrel protein [Candidatus Methylacidiphilales bacterium]